MEGPYLVDRGVPLDILGYLSGGAAATAGLIGSGLAAVLMVRMGTGGVLTLLGGCGPFALLCLPSMPSISSTDGPPSWAPPPFRR